MGPTFSFLDLGLRKPTDTRLRLNQQPSLCEATLPNTLPPNLMLFVWIHSGKLNIIHFQYTLIPEFSLDMSPIGLGLGLTLTRWSD